MQLVFGDCKWLSLEQPQPSPPFPAQSAEREIQAGFVPNDDSGPPWWPSKRAVQVAQR